MPAVHPRRRGLSRARRHDADDRDPVPGAGRALTLVADGDGFTVGSPHTAEYVEVPELAGPAARPGHCTAAARIGLCLTPIRADGLSTLAAWQGAAALAIAVVPSVFALGGSGPQRSPRDVRCGTAAPNPGRAGVGG